VTDSGIDGTLHEEPAPPIADTPAVGRHVIGDVFRREPFGSTRSRVVDHPYLHVADRDALGNTFGMAALQAVRAPARRRRPLLPAANRAW
jgi:hypothetical protein